jgi:uncharacterized protein YbjQ (UPF0145 family)
MTGPEPAARNSGPWDGRGLPPSALDRIARSNASHLSTSLLSIGGGVGIESVGFTPVGEVMGSCVMQIGFVGAMGCGLGYTFGASNYSVAPTLTSRTSNYAGYAPYVRALEDGYRTAISRMEAEAHEMGAHGVIGVQLTVKHRETGAREFVAMGTAVRGRVGPQPKLPARPFTTQLSGSDVTRALRGGWVPVSMVVAISVGIRHDDLFTQNQARSWTNTEVQGYTELVTTVRHEAREVFAQRIQHSGATRAYVTHMNVHVWSLEAPGHRDHAAESVVMGGGLVPFHRTLTPKSTSTLTMLPLRNFRRPK